MVSEVFLSRSDGRRCEGGSKVEMDVCPFGVQQN